MHSHQTRVRIDLLASLRSLLGVKFSLGKVPDRSKQQGSTHNRHVGSGALLLGRGLEVNQVCNGLAIDAQVLTDVVFDSVPGGKSFLFVVNAGHLEVAHPLRELILNAVQESHSCSAVLILHSLVSSVTLLGPRTDLFLVKSESDPVQILVVTAFISAVESLPAHFSLVA